MKAVPDLKIESFDECVHARRFVGGERTSVAASHNARAQ
jgi:hypothetical protein